MIIYAITAVLVIIAAVSDLKTHKIPNKLVFTGMLIGIVCNFYFSQLEGLKSSLLGLAAGFVFIVLFAFGVMGPGDIKLFMMVGSLLGPKMCLVSVILSFLIGGVVGVFVLIIRKNGRRRFMHLYRYLWITAVTRKPTTYDVIDAENQGYFSFGACIAAGTVTTMVLAYTEVLNMIINAIII